MIDENDKHFYANKAEIEMLKQEASDYWQLKDNMMTAIVTNKKEEIKRLVENGADFKECMHLLFGLGNFSTFKTFESLIKDLPNEDELYLNLVQLAYKNNSEEIINHLHHQVIMQDNLVAVIWLNENHDSINLDFAKKYGKEKIQSWLLSLKLDEKLENKVLIKRKKI